MLRRRNQDVDGGIRFWIQALPTVHLDLRGPGVHAGDAQCAIVEVAQTGEKRFVRPGAQADRNASAGGANSTPTRRLVEPRARFEATRTPLQEFAQGRIRTRQSSHLPEGRRRVASWRRAKRI
jgi:hypothetical protein